MEAKNQNLRSEPLEKMTLLTFHADNKISSVCYMDIIELEEGSIFLVTESKDPNIQKGDYIVKKGNPFHSYRSNAKEDILFRCYDLIKKP